MVSIFVEIEMGGIRSVESMFSFKNGMELKAYEFTELANLPRDA
jgi:hypothetical protein